jgi:hypothetical protein
MILFGGFAVDFYIGNPLIDMYVQCELLVCGSKMFDKMFQRDVVSWPELIVAYAKSRDMELEGELFHELLGKDVVAWTRMVIGYAQLTTPMAALEFFMNMHVLGMGPTSVTLVRFLLACAPLGAEQYANGVRDIAEIYGFGPAGTVVVGSAMIDMYSNFGSLFHCWAVFKGMHEIDRVVWNAIIFGLAMNGHVKTAVGLFGKIENIRIQPHGNIFIGFLCGSTHVGLVDESRRYFNTMNHVFSLTPTIERYGCMVALLGRAGLVDAAHKLIKGMPVEVNAIVWGALLNGGWLHRDNVLADHVLTKLIEFGPWHSGNYVLFSNIYSVSHGWDEAAKIRSRLNDNDIQNIPGCRWIEVDGVVHEFHAGYKFPPLSKQIYANLEELAMKLKVAGYVPSTDFIVFDSEEEEKEHFLGCHSKKLAIASGIVVACLHEGRQWMQNRFPWVRITGASGRFKATCFAKGSCTVWRSTWQELVALWTMSIFFARVQLEFLSLVSSMTWALPMPGPYMLNISI